MTIMELNKRLNQLVGQGYGDKPIYVEGNQENLEIDSVQKDTNPDVEPNYYFLMSGGRIE